MGWLEKVRGGDFNALPRHVTFDDACKIALLVEGYETAGGHAACMGISRCVVDRIARKVGDRISALDLWLSLFAQQRAHRFGGQPPTDDEIDLFLELVWLLRSALRQLNPEQKAGIMAIMACDETVAGSAHRE